MKKEKIKDILACIAVFLFSFFNIFSIAFLIFSFISFAFSKDERETWKYLEENGVLVEAVITDVVPLPDLENHEVYFTYEYNEREYTFMVYNYSGGRAVGTAIEAYIHPEKPEELIVYDGGSSYFFFIFFLVLAIVSGMAGFIFLLRKLGGK